MGVCLMSGGRGARLARNRSPAGCGEYLVVGEVQGAAASARVLAGARLEEQELDEIAGHHIEDCVTRC